MTQQIKYKEKYEEGKVETAKCMLKRGVLSHEEIAEDTLNWADSVTMKPKAE
ncbi:hypothetical protein AALB53_10800 [Lachnospiraceae bacterium 47-T17]